MLEKITPLVLTYNEAPNIARTLEKLRWASEVIVVDSFSTDDTAEIVSLFPNVRFFQRPFDLHASQWNFGLTETGIKTDWVLGMDADYVLTDEFIGELDRLQPCDGINAYRARFVYCINGKQLISGIYPPVSVLYRRQKAYYLQDGHTQTLISEGEMRQLVAPILHDDRKPLSHWLGAQSRYTKLEAGKLLSSTNERLSWTDRIRRWRIVAPPVMLLYCLFIRGGILDGRAGFYYAFQRMLAELMLSLYLLEHDFSRSPNTVTNESTDRGSTLIDAKEQR